MAALAVSLLLYLAERGAECAVILHYFLSDRWLWAGLTLALLLPGCFVQAVSFAWYRSDGQPPSLSLGLLHFLQLGILKRYVDCLSAVFRCQGNQPAERERLMMEGDLCVLRLLEALVHALPQSLLQVYIYLTLTQADAYAVSSALASLLSLSWALVSYSRFLSLLKPGQLSMPWASLLCQLLWRMGMIGTRVVALVVFARMYHFWVFAVIGAHWLVMSFWLVAHQTDILSKPCGWRMFNVLMGAVYTFCFINIKDGRSRYRVGVFYTIMLLENGVLLLLATDFLQEALWSNVKLCVAVMSGFLIGCAALIIYYTLLHPKSTEITHSFGNLACVTKKRKDELGLSSFCWNGAPRKEAHQSCRIEDQKSDIRYEDKATEARNKPPAAWEDVPNKHHHWLFLQLALKTGNMAKINAAFGADVFSHTITSGAIEDDKRVRPSSGDALASKRMSTEQLEENGETLACEGSLHEPSDYVTLRNTRPEEAPEVGTANGMLSGNVGLPNGEKLFFGTRSEVDAVCSPGSRAGVRDSATLYFSANMDGIVSPARQPEPIDDLPEAGSKLVTKINDAPDNAGQDDLPAICVSPILSLAANSNFQRSVLLDMDESTQSDDDWSEVLENFLEKNRLHLLPLGALPPSVKGRLIQEEKPCFTSTPKAPSSGTADPALHVEAKARRKLAQLTEKT
uniref:XK-related protein n=1 Tax=Leptobrachium leishanense TaxID=445787 RepID=A0A8C5PE45_9ANUR